MPIIMPIIISGDVGDPWCSFPPKKKTTNNQTKKKTTNKQTKKTQPTHRLDLACFYTT